MREQLNEMLKSILVDLARDAVLCREARNMCRKSHPCHSGRQFVPLLNKCY